MNHNFQIGKVYESDDSSLIFELIKLTETHVGFDYGMIKINKDNQNYINGPLTPIPPYQSEKYQGMYEVPLDYLTYLILNVIK